MGLKCIVCRRNAKKSPELSFHKFPKNKKIRDMWLKILKMSEVKNWYRICSDHFDEDDYRPNTIKFCLKKNAMPKEYTLYVVTYSDGQFLVNDIIVV